MGHINFANMHFGIKEWIYAFHMPVFFFSSGLVLRESDPNVTFLKKKFNVLILPYILWGLIYSSLSVKNICYLMFGSYETLSRANTLTSLWFLPAMFFGILLTQLIFKFLKKDYQRIIAIIFFTVCGVLIPNIAIGYPLCIDVAILTVPFILFGFYFEKIMVGKSDAIMIILTIVGLALTMLYRLNDVQQSSNVLMARRYIGNPILFFVVAVGGCFMVYGISRLLDRENTRPIISFIGKNTLAIFAVHKPLIVICEKIFNHVYAPWYLALLLSVIITLSASCVLVLFINSFIPILNGRSK